MKRKGRAKKKVQQYNYPLIGIIVAIVLVVGIALIHRQLSGDMQQVITYDGCIAAKGSTRINTFPEQCKTKDNITYIKEVIEPLDTTDWKAFADARGFTFLCPPSWDCTKLTETAAVISQSHYAQISTFQLSLISPATFQQSNLRNPNYNNPMSWYKDLSAKNNYALQAPISTRVYKFGTDGYSDPDYVQYDYSTMEQMQTGSSEALIFPARENNPDTDVLVPLDDTSFVIIKLSPGSLYKDPIVKEIIKSVKAD